MVAKGYETESSDPSGSDGSRYFDEKIKAALEDAKAMDTMFMNGEFEHAVEEALNMFVRCVEALISLIGLSVGDRSGSLSVFDEVFLSERGERVSGVDDHVWDFVKENKEKLGRDFEADFVIMRAVALNQNLRIGIASSPRKARDLVIKLSWMSHRLIKHGGNLKAFISSQQKAEE